MCDVVSWSSTVGSEEVTLDSVVMSFTVLEVVLRVFDSVNVEESEAAGLVSRLSLDELNKPSGVTLVELKSVGIVSVISVDINDDVSSSWFWDVDVVK